MLSPNGNWLRIWPSQTRQRFDDATPSKGQKRPADVIGNAVKVMKIATCEEAEELETDRAKSAAAELGKRGGKAPAAKLTPERRGAIARQGARARWKGQKKAVPETAE
jgi:hypothetical protein